MIRFIHVTGTDSVRVTRIDADGLMVTRTHVFRTMRDEVQRVFFVSLDSLPVGTIGRQDAAGVIQWNNNAGLPKVGRPRLDGFAPMTGVERARKRRALLKKNKIEKD